ncbi:MAG TPA: STM3941 family protein [Edaphocola sp.]|nr:STM3941 family protein [Edaphocola sp.]
MAVKRNIVRLLGSAAFFAVFFVLGIKFFLVEKDDPLFAAVICALAVLVIGLAFVFGKKNALVLNESGISISNGLLNNIGQISWSEIKGVDIQKKGTSESLLLFLHHPDKIVARVSGLKRWNLTHSYKLLGTPVAIYANTLKCDLNDLKNDINQQLDHSPGF